MTRWRATRTTENKMPEPYRLYGCTQSYFTRKLQAYLDYKKKSRRWI